MAEREYGSGHGSGHGLGTGFAAIRAIDCTVLLVRDMAAMRGFYEGVMGFAVARELSDGWIEYHVGAATLALSLPGLTRSDPPVPPGAASVQLAFRVPPADVDRCAAQLAVAGVAALSPPTDQPFGHRTLFFRDPDGNLLEIYAEI